MLSTLSALFELIKSAPIILSAFIEIKKTWDQYLDVEERREMMQKFGEAWSETRKTRDTTQLTNLVNSIVAGKPNK